MFYLIVQYLLILGMELSDIENQMKKVQQTVKSKLGTFIMQDLKILVKVFSLISNFILMLINIHLSTYPISYLETMSKIFVWLI